MKMNWHSSEVVGVGDSVGLGVGDSVGLGVGGSGVGSGVVVGSGVGKYVGLIVGRIRSNVYKFASTSNDHSPHDRPLPPLCV